MHGQKRGVQPQQGFTLIEILVAIALLGLLAAVLTSTLTGSLSLNRQAQKQLDTTTNVQQLLEKVRSAWATQDSYDKACAPSLIVPSGYTVKFVNLSSRAEPVNSAGTVVTGTTAAPSYTLMTSATCPAASLTNGGSVGTSTIANPPTMRRVTVQSGTLPAGSTTPTVGAQDIALTLDILRPE